MAQENNLYLSCFAPNINQVVLKQIFDWMYQAMKQSTRMTTWILNALLIRNALLIIMNDQSFKMSLQCICTSMRLLYTGYPYIPVYNLTIDSISFDWHQNIKECNIVSKILLIFEIFNKAFLKVQAIIANEILNEF